MQQYSNWEGKVNKLKVVQAGPIVQEVDKVLIYLRLLKVKDVHPNF